MVLERGIQITIKKINSIKNEKIIEARKLTSATGRMNFKKILLYGLDSIKWAFEAKMNIEHVFICDVDYDTENTEWLVNNDIKYYYISEGIAKKITNTSYVIPYIGISRIYNLIV